MTDKIQGASIMNRERENFFHEYPNAHLYEEHKNM
jgi:hypothetical protein